MVSALQGGGENINTRPRTRGENVNKARIREIKVKIKEKRRKDQGSRQARVIFFAKLGVSCYLEVNP